MSASEGHVYVMVNAGIPGLLKIGATIYDPLLRAKQLSASTSSPVPFVCAYHRKVRDPFVVEAALHRELDIYRVNDSREFFRLPLHEAISLLEQYDDIERSTDYLYPFASLFASFPDDGSDRELTDDERAACRALDTQIRARVNR
jgi:hypothetical protein